MDAECSVPNWKCYNLETFNMNAFTIKTRNSKLPKQTYKMQNKGRSMDSSMSACFLFNLSFKLLQNLGAFGFNQKTLK